MKISKKILVLLLALLLFVNTAIPAFALAISSEVKKEAGKVAHVEFKYENVKSVGGQITYSNRDLFSDVKISASGLTATINDKTGMIGCYGISAADCIISLELTISSKARPGDSCEIVFTYESSADGSFSTEPDYKVDKVVVVVKETIDYSELEKQIAIAESLKKNAYTTASWTVMRNALKAAKDALKSEVQSVVNSATANLKNAIAALVKAPVPIDYSDLKKLIAIAEDLNASEYTETTWEKLEKALANAKSALKSQSQTTVNNAAAALRSAINGLVRIPVVVEIDYSELKRQISIAESLVSTEYTEESWVVLLNVLDVAKKALSAKTQKEVNDAAAALSQAITSLVKAAAPIDYTELKRQIAIAEGLKQGDYTAISWAVFAEAFDKAKLALESRSQAEVDVAALALKDAMSKLVRMDYSALLAAIDSVSKYALTEELAGLWLRMHELLVKAQDLLTSGDQAAVDACAKEITDLLTEIIKALAEIKKTETIFIEKPTPVNPNEDFCNIGMHRVWPILFWISFAINVILITLIILFFATKRKKEKDATPLVDYDITDDISEDDDDVADLDDIDNVDDVDDIETVEAVDSAVELESLEVPSDEIVSESVCEESEVQADESVSTENETTEKASDEEPEEANE